MGDDALAVFGDGTPAGKKCLLLTWMVHPLDMNLLILLSCSCINALLEMAVVALWP